jgi:hypothetical protein
MHGCKSNESNRLGAGTRKFGVFIAEIGRKIEGKQKSFADEYLTGQASRAHDEELLSMLLLVVVLLSTGF